jgi:hypothetical protein
MSSARYFSDPERSLDLGPEVQRDGADRCTSSSENPAPQQFRKRPVVIEAMQWQGTEASQRAIVNWSGGIVSGWFDSTYYLVIRSLEGEMRADVGDWIIRGVQGEFHPCKPDIFAATYEAVQP